MSIKKVEKGYKMTVADIFLFIMGMAAGSIIWMIIEG